MHRSTTGRFYPLLSWLICLSLLLQLMVPPVWLPAAQAQQAQNSAAAAAVPFPSALSQPVTISRAQSGHSSGELIEVVYTITNNLLPTQLPEVADSATITDTLDILAGVDLSADINTVRDLSVETTLAGGTLVDGHGAAVNGSTLSWTLPDLPPMASTTVTLTMQAPAAAAGFIDLDSGAAVAGTLWDNPVTAAARPVAVIPDNVDPAYLASTIDANAADEWLLRATAQFAQAPEAGFAWVQSFAYDPYKGSLRGTRGTLLGEAGNALDQSSLLIAALRAAGIPARYRHGTLATADAQTLIDSMFAFTAGAAGQLPAGAGLADPRNDAALLAVVQDHWWVEAYLPGAGWTDLDPSFPNAAIGDSFGVPGAHDRVAEVPDEQRHKTAVSVRREYYSTFPVGGVNLVEEDVMAVEYATAALAGRALTYAHMVSSDSPPGMVFGSITHTFTPYFMLDDDADNAVLGDTFQDLLTNFPLATTFTTAAWLTFTLTDVDGNADTFERTVKDDLGPDVRLNGGSPDLARSEDSPPFFGASDLMTTVFMPNAVAPQALDQVRGTMLGRLVEVAGLAAAANALTDDGTPEAAAVAGDASLGLQVLMAQSHALTAYDFAQRGDELLHRIGTGLQVHFFYDQPRIITLTTTADEEAGTSEQSMDLRNTMAAAIVAPGQITNALQAANWVKGVGESALEGAVLTDFYEETAVTTAFIFDQMHAQGIEPVLLTPEDLDQLEIYPFTSDVRALLTNTLLDGKHVLVPVEPVQLNGEPTFAWWQIDPGDGTTIGVLADGTHGALLEYLNWLGWKRYGAINRAFGLPVKLLYKYLEWNLIPALGGSARPAAPAADWRFLPPHQCPIASCGTEQFFLPEMAGSPIPLPDNLFAYGQERQQTDATAASTVIVSGSGGGADSAALTPAPGSAAITPFGVVSFDAGLSATFSDEFVLQLHAPDGWDAALDGSDATVTPPAAAAPGSYELLLAAQSKNRPEVTVLAAFPVTVSAANGLAFGVTAEPNITLPQNEALFAAVANETNDGEAEIPDSAYRIDLTNESGSSKSFTIDVSGAPAGWVLLDGAVQTSTAVTLAPGEATAVGLYIQPEILPAPGASYAINVAVSDGAGLNDSDVINWTMAGQAHSYLTLTPDTLFVEANSSVDFDLELTNVGNSAGSFPLAATTPLTSATFTNLQTPFSLNPDETDTQTVTLNVGDAALGARFPLVIAADSPDGYTQYALADIQIVSPVSGALFAAARSCTLDSPSLADALDATARNAVELEYWCGQGECPLVLRDNVAGAADSAAIFADSLTFGSNLATIEPVRDAAADLATQTADADILTALAELSTAVTGLSTDLCEVGEHRAGAQFTPYLDAVLLGESAGFTLGVTNHGTVDTTYDVTVTGLPGGDATFNPTINAGETISLPVNISPAALGTLDLLAAVDAVSPDVIVPVGTTAAARLNVVAEFVQVTAVTADPPFVDTGGSQTSLSMEVNNVAGIAQEVTAQVEILDATGSVQAQLAPELTILIGSRTYELGVVDTSGWDAGVYTIGVTLVEGADPVSGGSGAGAFTVGQSLLADMVVTPQVVPPGDVTVTTVISTTLQEDAVIAPPAAAPLWAPTGLRLPDGPAAAEDAAAETAVGIAAPPVEPDADTAPAVEEGTPLPQHPDTIVGTVILRYEEDEASITGTWTTHTNGPVSGGSYLRADTTGEAATFTVNGTWFQLGFLGDNWSGNVEVSVDGISQGVFDLYRREATPLSFVFDGFSSGAHTITVTALGSANPLSNRNYVQLDYLDVFDTGSYADTTVEQDDARLLRGGSWFEVSDAGASGGSYMRSSNGTAWFPFTGESISLQAVAYNNGGTARIYLDGVYQTTLDLYHPDGTITRTLSFDGLGAGAHVLQISDYRGNTTVDAITTPGTAPFYTPPGPESFTRYEEEYPDMLYNGVPYTVTAQTWTQRDSILENPASDGQLIDSRTAGDTAALTFDGAWVSVGFFTDDTSGEAEIFIDGISQGVIDLYSNEDDVTSVSYDLTPGTHTISVTVLGTANPFSSNSWVRLDYIDVWDGTPLPDGAFEESDGRILRSDGWVDVANAEAGGGGYAEASLHGAPTFWFPFTGDSVTYQAFDYFRSDEVAIYIDEELQGYYDINTGAAPTITHSFENLGPGLHILKVRAYREEPTLDRMITPAITPQTPPAAPQVFTRVEEDGTAVRFNGVSFQEAPSSWVRIDNLTQASDGQMIYSAAAGDWISFDFSGTWLQVGFYTDRFGGQAEIIIDGVSREVVDLYTTEPGVASFSYDGMADGTHTVEIHVLGSAHPNSIGTRVHLDYFDTWSGDPLPADTYEEDHPLVYYGDYVDNWAVFTDPAASGGSYRRDGFQRDSTVWFPFTGDSITFLGMAYSGGERIEISIDGVSQGTFNLYSREPESRAFSFDGLGSGPHVIEIRHNRDYLAVDGFITPGTAPFVDASAPSGIVRYEEDNPALVYNGQDSWRTRPQSWVDVKSTFQVSGGWNVYSSQVGDTVALTFDGNWAAVGFRVRNGAGQAEIFIDGDSQGLFDLDNDPGEDVRTFQFGDLITGTHTISVSVASGTVYLDYIDVWDGQPMGDELVNAQRGADNVHLHYTSTLVDVESVNAFNGDMVMPTIFNFPANVWYTFTGDSFTLFGVTDPNGGELDVYIDDVFVERLNFAYPYTRAPRDVHYTGLEDGPHVVRISSVSGMRVDAFQANPVQTTPYLPTAEWWDDSLAGNGAPLFGTVGVAAGMAAGDLEGDGSVEIVVTGDDTTNFGTMNVYRGDGGDTGDGDPIIWSQDFGGGAFRTWVSSPAIAELDGQPGAEIIVAAGNELWAFHADGSTYWTVPTASIFETLTAPAVGNLDLDPEPEIVVNLRDTIEVREHDGTLAWSTVYPEYANPPILADLTGDGALDIVITGWDDDVLVYDYNNGTPQLVWSALLSSSMSGTFGAPAVADIDGDGQPEVMVSHYGALTVFNGEDGSVVWSETLDPGNPGGVSVADLNGDGAVDILTGMRYEFETDRFGMLYALNSDGSLLWSAVAEDSSSANNAAALDLNGDGTYEVAWNGREQGFTIFNGVDGSVLFNEPQTYSVTGTDYPLFIDVDSDGSAEIIAPTLRGIVVFGQDGVWDETRSVWNQHSYHITNVNDDLTIPSYEYNSWEVHNTYRTQYPQEQVLPVYDVAVTYTAGSDRVTVVEPTISMPPTVSAPPLYSFEYTQEWFQPVISITLDSEVTGLVPGEVRQVAAGAEVSYTLPTGTNMISLPAQYVQAARLIRLGQESATVTAGETAVFTATLTNPGSSSDTFTLAVAGPAAEWVEYPANVQLPAGGELVIELIVNVPIGAPGGELPLLVDVTTGSGSGDTGQMALIILPDTPPPFEPPASGTPSQGMTLALQPETAVGGPGATAVYTLTVKNLSNAPDTYDLTVDLPAGWAAELKQNGAAISSVTVATGAYDQAEVRLLVTPPAGTASGEYPVTVTAVSQTNNVVTTQAAGTLSVGSRGVTVAITPAARTISYGGATSWTLTVTNSGTQADTFDLTAAGVVAPWVTLGSSSVTLNPGESQNVTVTAANVRLLPQTAVVAMTAVSRAEATIVAETAATLTVLPVTDMALAWTPATQTITGTVTTFGLQLTNTGSTLADASVSVSVAGGTAQVNAAQVDVPAGFGAMVPVTVQVPGDGRYNVEATVVLPGGIVRTATAELLVGSGDTGLIVYMPFIILDE